MREKWTEDDTLDLLYFYPEKNDAPAKVGKSIIKELINYKNILPFDNIKLITEKSKEKEKYGLKIIKFSDILRYSNEYIIHIPLSPNVMPNKKFLINLFSIIKNNPLIIHYHGDFRENVLMQLRYGHKIDFMALPSAIFIPYILKNTTKVVTHSFLINEIVKKRYGVENSIVIPNGLEDFWFYSLKDLGELPSQIYFDKNKLNIFYHGRLAPEKGVDLLVEAVSKYIERNSNTKLYIAGDGNQKKSLVELSSKLNIGEHVVFLGNIDKNTIKYFLQNSDIAIYPSRFDAFCLSIMEAFACSNCPVYFSNKAGVYDFVEREGYQLNSFHPTVENIVQILNLIEELETNKQCIISQREFAKKYSWNNIITHYINLYSGMM